ncbi:MAG: hypothetical protein Q8O67_03770 [Deltaproteobacteria bacterium]|nr:hypothetical protein [Deltaproteobacteria bacterium]
MRAVLLRAPARSTLTREASSHSGATLRAVVVVGVAFGLLGCVEEGPAGTTGAKGLVVFQAETALVFSSRVAVGSTFAVTTVPKDDEETKLSEATTLASADDDVVTVTRIEGDDLAFDVVVTGPGRVELTVKDDGDDVDSIFVEAARAVDTTLVDSALLSASDAVDPRLPERFAVIDDAPTRFLVSAIDKCGGPLLDLGASQLVIRGEGDDPTVIDLAEVTADGAAAFFVEPALESGGVFTIDLVSPDIETLSYEVDVVGRGDVDEVHAEVASVDTQAATARLWGRAFVDDVDVIGLTYDWSVDERVGLDAVSGAAVTATIGFVADEEGLDLRPATVSAEVFGTNGVTDLLVLQAGDLVVGRPLILIREVPPAEDEEVTGPASCACTDTSGGCNALAAIGAAWTLNRRRRRS